jgi:DNA recombination protein RmuC
MWDILFIVGDVAVTTGAALMAFAGLVLALLLTIAMVLARGARRNETATLAQAMRADEMEERLADMLRAQPWARPWQDASRKWRG